MALEFKDNGIGKLIGIFILALLGIVFASTIGDSLSSISDTSDVVNETITIASGTGTTENDHLITITEMQNGTDALCSGASGCTIADFNWTALTGVVLVPVNVSNGLWNISYTFEPSTYVAQATPRTILNSTILIFFAVGVLLFVIGWFYSGQVKEFFGK